MMIKAFAIDEGLSELMAESMDVNEDELICFGQFVYYKTQNVPSQV